MTQSSGQGITTYAPGFLKFLSDGVVVLDRDQQIVTANKMAAHILGWSKSELVGKFWLELLKDQPTLVNRQVDETAYLNRVAWFPFDSSNSKDNEEDTDDPTLVYHTELTLKCKNGSHREVIASFSPLYHTYNLTETADNIKKSAADEQAGFSLVILRDITEQDRLERIKTQFVVTAAHQLRTPLASIKHSVGLLLENVSPTLTQPLLRLLQNIQNSSSRMERLVNNLVELTNLQTGLVQMGDELVEVSRILEQAVAANQENLQQKAQPLELILPPTPLFVKGDNARLTQILGHLLANANKFSLPGSLIILKTTVDNSHLNSSYVTFSVTDKGCGISLEEQPLIFEKFYQSEVSENADGSGAGLGLPLAKALVELHGGRLWLESTPGQGSTFYFKLPLMQIGPTNQPREG